jgi:hypothetical protein
MTARSRRRQERKLALRGDFPDTGKSITELIRDVEPASYDSTIPFRGASAGTMPPAEAHREAGLRQAVEMTDPEWELEVNEAGHPTGNLVKPGTRLRALPPHPPVPPRPHYAPRDTGPMPKLSRYAARPRPQRPADDAIFIYSKLLQQHIMKCGQAHFVAGDNPDGSDDTWRLCQRRYADPIAGTLPFAFEALRVSAWTSGWRLDAFDRWGCPACQMTPAWHARYTVTLWAEGAGWARLHHDPDAEWGAIAIAEQDLIRDVADAAKQGRHRVSVS